MRLFLWLYGKIENRKVRGMIKKIGIANYIYICLFVEKKLCIVQSFKVIKALSQALSKEKSVTNVRNVAVIIP